MIRLVHPAPKGQDPPIRRRRQILGLSPDERQHLRAALHNLRREYGSWKALAEAMKVKKDSLAEATRAVNPRGFPALALIVARVAKIPVESILSGKLVPAGQCPTCGSTVNARFDRTGGAS